MGYLETFNIFVDEVLIPGKGHIWAILVLP